jgi:hypothetical protein
MRPAAGAGLSLTTVGLVSTHLSGVQVLFDGIPAPVEVRAYRLLDNRSHEETLWDDDLLGSDYSIWKERGLGEGLKDADAAPAIPVTAVNVPGDLWILGEHRLLCGDATAASSLERVLDGGRADMVFTDPPYNVDYSQPAHILVAVEAIDGRKGIDVIGVT